MIKFDNFYNCSCSNWIPCWQGSLWRELHDLSILVLQGNVLNSLDYLLLWSLSTMVKPDPGCGHSGCWHCHATLIGIETFPKFPLCKALIRTGTLHVNIALHDIIGNFDVKCNKSSCLWTGKFHKHEQHLKTCGKFQMPCANDGCREVVTRERMAAHTVQCTKHKLPCQQCSRKITRESFKEHTASLCSNKRVLCPLSCGTSLPQ